MFASDSQTASSWWMVLPKDEAMEFQGKDRSVHPSKSSESSILMAKRGPLDRAIFVKNGDVIRLQHFETGAFLFAHELASPITAGNLEVAGDSPS